MRSPGDRFDRYVLERLVGRGGMGEVWRAVDPKLDRRVALKILPPADALDPTWARARARMLREARSAAALNHPNVVAVFDVGEMDGMPYIAMELVEGATLREYIADASVPPRRRAQWTLEIARALAAAHQSGVVHRDVKPENVMVRHDGTLKVLDFGIARHARVGAMGLSERAASVITNDGELLGTLLYMAPEQFDGSAVDARADQFAWGVVALELLRGEHPWRSKRSPIAILDALRDEVPPAVEASAELPPGLPAAIARATAKLPRDRFPSMDALLDAIEGSTRLPALRRGPTSAEATEGATSQPVTIASRPGFTPGLTLGTLLAGRFELVRPLGRGGMGEVYEAIDRTDGARVALKTVRAERAGDPLVVERFRREIDLARRVVHPNVARVIDACVHESPAEPEPILLLAMELLTGESLAALVERRGALSIDEARPLARAMTSALGAAHAAGVVHRDFKSANVFLEPRAGAGEKLRVVVTDFGLARTLDASDTSLSRDVALLGTPAYMAPEQVAGTAVDQRADVYALGVVLFEMATGRLPFVGDTPIEGAMMRLNNPPPSPRALVPTLDEAWNRAIVRCMQREPSDRFTSASEVAAAIEGSAATRAGAARARKWGLALVAACVIVATALFMREERARPIASAPAASNVTTAAAPIADAKRRPAIGVVAPKNLGGRADAQWVSAALSEMIGTELAAGEALRIVPAERIDRASRELGLGEASSFAPETLSRLRANVGTDYVVAGSYLLAGDQSVRVDLTLQDARSAATVAKIGATGTRSKLPELAASLGASLREKLGLADPTQAQRATARAAIASNPRALEEFTHGQIRYRAADYAGARDAFTRSIAADPSYPLAHAALSEALWALGEEPSSFREAKIAYDASRTLSRADQLVVEARYRFAAKDYARGAEIYQALVAFFPDDIAYGMSYASFLDNAGKSAEALAVLDQLRKLPPPDGDDPRIDNSESLIADHVGDQKRCLAAARAALPKAEARGQTRTAADAHRLIGEALWGLDDVTAALPELESARALYEKLDDEADLSTTLAETAGIHGQRGAPAKALPLLEHALELARAVGDRFRIATRLRRVGDTLQELGDERSARVRWQEAHDLCVAINDARGLGRLTGRLAMVSLADGDLKRAHSGFLDARARAQALGNRTEIMEETQPLAQLALETGDVAEAEREATAGVALARELQDHLAQADLTLTLAGAARQRGDRAASAKLAEEARAGFERAQGALGAQLTAILRASLALDGGEIAEAERLARGAIEALHAGGYRGYEASALATLATILVARGSIVDASSAVDRAEALAPQRFATKLDVSLARARVLGASPEGLARSAAIAADVGGRAEKAGLLPRAREARILQARAATGALPSDP